MSVAANEASDALETNNPQFGITIAVSAEAWANPGAKLEAFWIGKIITLIFSSAEAFAPALLARNPFFKMYSPGGSVSE